MRKYLRAIARHNMTKKYGMENLNKTYWTMVNGTAVRVPSVFSREWRKYIHG